MRLECAKLIFSEAKVGKNARDISFFLGIESRRPACNVKAFPVVLVNQVGAVVGNESVIVEVHDEPLLVISHAVVVAVQSQLTWCGAILANKLVSQPNLRSIDCDRVE